MESGLGDRILQISDISPKSLLTTSASHLQAVKFLHIHISVMLNRLFIFNNVFFFLLQFPIFKRLAKKASVFVKQAM